MLHRKFAVLVLLLFLAGCNLPTAKLPTVSTTSPGSASAVPGGDGLPLNANASPSANENGSAPRSTVQPVESLATQMPALMGMYWTQDLVVQKQGAGVSILAGIPCTQLLDLLGSGQWTLTKGASPQGTSSTLFPFLAELKLDNQTMLVKAYDLGTYGEPFTGTPGTPLPTATSTPTPEPSATPNIRDLAGCRATVQPIFEQTVEAHGEQETQGSAIQYPIPLGCTVVNDTVSVNVAYEGPGDFRIVLQFSAPRAIGEQTLSAENFELNVFHSSIGLIELFKQQAQEESLNASKKTFSPQAESFGSLTITSLDPFSGEVWANSLVDEESSAVQSFHATFSCDPLKP